MSFEYLKSAGNLAEIRIADLFVMQESLRNIHQITKMIEFVKNGGFWSREALDAFALQNGIRHSPLMEIAVFPNRMMIHDGHHRIVSIFLGGRDYIREDEYVVKHWNYSNYMGINFKTGWVTPFDPNCEIRLPDISAFKRTALGIANFSEENAISFIKSRKDCYAKPRTMNSVASLAATLNDINIDSMMTREVLA